MPAGVVRYISPEQIEGKTVDGRTDLYSLGAVLCRMTTGHPPRTGSDLAIDPATLTPDLAGFILRLLAPDQAVRFESAQSALAELKAIRDRQPKPASNPWFWMTVSLAVTLTIVVAGWLFNIHRSYAVAVVPMR